MILGFDPGGKGNFGWCVCQADGDELQVRQTCVANDAQDAIRQVKSAIKSLVSPGNPKVLAAGIDAPMFWSATGNREIDGTIREELKKRNSSKEKGAKVLAVNSLWGSVLAQGVLLGKYLHKTYPDLQITETHPKALLQLLTGEGNGGDSGKLLNCLFGNEDKRDAAISAYAAWKMWKDDEDPTWRNLYHDEPGMINPFCTPVSYWMPIPHRHP